MFHETIMSDPAKACLDSTSKSRICEKLLKVLQDFFFVFNAICSGNHVSIPQGVCYPSLTNNSAAIQPSLWIQQQSLDSKAGLSLPVTYLPPEHLFPTGNILLCGHFCTHFKWFVSFCFLGCSFCTVRLGEVLLASYVQSSTNASDRLPSLDCTLDALLQ